MNKAIGNVNLEYFQPFPYIVIICMCLIIITKNKAYYL